MRISVNLATRPFVELRPLFSKLRLAIAALAIVAAADAFWLHALTAKARAAEAQMNALRAKTTQYQQERQRNEARMRQPQNMAVLEPSRFLNALFAQKSFSWTAVMMDLERVLPAGVQVTSIDPATTKNGDVNIRLKVSGDRDRAVELVRNLERSQRFITPRIAGEAAQAQETGRLSASVVAPGAVEFDILSGYNPLPSSAPKDQTRAAAASEGSRPTADEVSRASGRVGSAKAAPQKQQPMIGGVR